MVSLTSQHIERHVRGSAVVRDAVIGMSDGLTVPFALAAGLSGAVASSGIVVTAAIRVPACCWEAHAASAHLD